MLCWMVYTLSVLEYSSIETICNKCFFSPHYLVSFFLASRFAMVRYCAGVIALLYGTFNTLDLAGLTKGLSHLTPNKTSALFFFIISLIIPLNTWYVSCKMQLAVCINIALALLLKFNWTEIEERNRINKGKRCNEMRWKRVRERGRKEKKTPLRHKIRHLRRRRTSQVDSNQHPTHRTLKTSNCHFVCASATPYVWVSLYSLLSLCLCVCTSLTSICVCVFIQRNQNSRDKN